MTTQPTPTIPRAFNALHTARLARTLLTLAPQVRTVRLSPMWTDGTGRIRRTTHVVLMDEGGRPVDADRAAHRAALTAIRAAHTLADWDRPHRYELRTGRLVPLDCPWGPRALTAGGAR